MRLIIINQNDSFYLSYNLKYLLNHLPNVSKVVGLILDRTMAYGFLFCRS